MAVKNLPPQRMLFERRGTGPAACCNITRCAPGGLGCRTICRAEPAFPRQRASRMHPALRYDCACGRAPGAHACRQRRPAQRGALRVSLLSLAGWLPEGAVVFSSALGLNTRRVAAKRGLSGCGVAPAQGAFFGGATLQFLMLCHVHIFWFWFVSSVTAALPAGDRERAAQGERGCAARLVFASLCQGPWGLSVRGFRRGPSRPDRALGRSSGVSRQMMCLGRWMPGGAPSPALAAPGRTPICSAGLAERHCAP